MLYRALHVQWFWQQFSLICKELIHFTSFHYICHMSYVLIFGNSIGALWAFQPWVCRNLAVCMLGLGHGRAEEKTRVAGSSDEDDSKDTKGAVNIEWNQSHPLKALPFTIFHLPNIPKQFIIVHPVLATEDTWFPALTVRCNKPRGPTVAIDEVCNALLAQLWQS